MNVSEYLLMVVGASSAGIIADIVNSSVSNRIRGLEKYIKFGVTLCIASCMVIPLMNITKGDEWLELKTTPYNEYTNNDAVYSENYILERECEEELFNEIWQAEEYKYYLESARYKHSFEELKKEGKRVCFAIFNSYQNSDFSPYLLEVAFDDDKHFKACNYISLYMHITIIGDITS